jgi:hypothetical protein
MAGPFAELAVLLQVVLQVHEVLALCVANRGGTAESKFECASMYMCGCNHRSDNKLMEWHAIAGKQACVLARKEGSWEFMRTNRVVYEHKHLCKTSEVREGMWVQSSEKGQERLS